MGPSSTRTSIAEAAALEFLAHGYAGASLASIAERLGLTKGALTYQFPTKVDFATYFEKIVRAATSQAYAFARAEYPENGSYRVLLNYLVMSSWRAREPQLAAGLALFVDVTSPAFEAVALYREWLNLTLESFELCRSNALIPADMNPEDAAEIVVVASIGALFVGQQLVEGQSGTQPLRLVALALTAIGVSNALGQAQEIIEIYGDSLPGFEYPPQEIVTRG